MTQKTESKVVRIEPAASASTGYQSHMYEDKAETSVHLLKQYKPKVGRQNESSPGGGELHGAAAADVKRCVGQQKQS